MTTLPPNDTFDFGDSAAHNEAALAELTSAIAFAQGANTITLLLVRCNYTQLRDRMVAALLTQLAEEELQGQVHVLRLAAHEHNLYAQVQATHQQQRPGAVLVLGMETIEDLETLLVEANKRREEFRRDFPFPLVLWFTDDGYQQLSHFANDFESIASGETLEFRWAGAVLSQQLQDAAQRMFAALLNPDTLASFNQRLINLELGSLNVDEVDIALADLQAQNYPLDPDLQASVIFAQGLNVPNAEAARLFDASAIHWESYSTDPQAALKLGLALFYLGRSRYFIADEVKYRRPNWAKAVPPLEECLTVFEQAHRPDLVAQSINQLQRTLRRLKRWDELETLTQQALPLHQTEGTRSLRAQDYGHLAEVALQRQQWPQAMELAQQAIKTLPTPADASSWPILFRKTLADAQYAAGQVDAATANLRTARSLGVMEHPKLHSDVLLLLQQCLRQQQRYLEAFEIKRERLAIEQQYGLRAFIGAGRLRAKRTEKRVNVRAERQTLEDIAPEIAASGRYQDLTELLNRIAGKTHKLLVLHGASGVGKSSLINGGLLPALQARALDNRNNLPILIRQYTDWPRELADRFADVVATSQPESTHPPIHPSTLPTLLKTLRDCEAATLRPVIIFDQFEEFFFANPDPLARRVFFQFLIDCLELQPSALKIVLSLREDYLHYLLEAKQLVRQRQLAVGSLARSQLEDILGKQILYEIGNFAPADAKAIMQRLSSGSRMYLESQLIDALVDDLAGELQEVRPIEMQIVGAQLQTDGIQTLTAYRDLGEQPKETLVQRYLEDVVQDCGDEANQKLAELVLFLLTDERGTRPLKTRPELVRDLEALGVLVVQESGVRSQELGATSQVLGIAASQTVAPLDQVLWILCGSGICVQLPDTPDDRYQLVHDYLAGVVRARQTPRWEALMVELEEERRKRLAAESETLVLADANRKARRRLLFSSGLLAVSLVAALLASTLANSAQSKANRAERELREITQLVSEQEEAAEDAEARENKAKIELEQAELQAQQAAQDLRRIQAKADVSEQEIEAAQQKLEAAENQFSQTQQELQKALQQSAVARQEQVEAEQSLAEAEKKVEEANQQVAQVNQEAKTAQNEISLARQIVNLEREATAVSNRFNYFKSPLRPGQIDQLLAAIQIGHSLKSIINPEAELGEYPAFNPIYTLDQIIQNIQEINRFRHHSGVRSLAFSPDGTQILTSSFNEVRV